MSGVKVEGKLREYNISKLYDPGACLRHESGFENINLYKETVHGTRSRSYTTAQYTPYQLSRTLARLRPEDSIATSPGRTPRGDNEAMYT